jgi:tRNA 5-methylaminomethyl-2-thiouridine biosynthesis bifunctional protein
MGSGQRLDQARLLPREAGLFVLTALGARGLTLAPLLGRLVAAQATGTPWPLEQDLADAVDPARWIVRAARAGSSGLAGGPGKPQAG